MAAGLRETVTHASGNRERGTGTPSSLPRPQWASTTGCCPSRIQSVPRPSGSARRGLPGHGGGTTRNRHSRLRQPGTGNRNPFQSSEAAVGFDDRVLLLAHPISTATVRERPPWPTRPWRRDYAKPSPAPPGTGNGEPEPLPVFRGRSGLRRPGAAPRASNQYRDRQGASAVAYPAMAAGLRETVTRASGNGEPGTSPVHRAPGTVHYPRKIIVK